MVHKYTLKYNLIMIWDRMSFEEPFTIESINSYILTCIFNNLLPIRIIYIFEKLFKKCLQFNNSNGWLIAYLIDGKMPEVNFWLDPIYCHFFILKDQKTLGKSKYLSYNGEF